MPADCSPGVAQQNADSQAYNAKLLQDVATLGLYTVVMNGALLGQQAVIDNQINARARASNSASSDLAIVMNNVTTDQTGATNNQAPQTPIKQAAADATTQMPPGAAYPPIRNVDQGAATANSGIQAAMQSIADAMANLQTQMQTAMTALQNSLGNAAKPGA